MAQTDMEKIKILLKHWVEHNEEHGEDFQEWAEKAKSHGHTEVHDDILRAVEKMREANEYLLRALENFVVVK